MGRRREKGRTNRGNGRGRNDEIMSPSVLLLLPLLWRLFNRPISTLGRVNYYKSYNEEPLEIAGVRCLHVRYPSR